MQDNNTDYQCKFREILQTSTSFKEVQDKINNLISNSGSYFKISSVHYVKYPTEGFKIFYSVSLPFSERDTSYSELRNFIRGFSNIYGFVMFGFNDVPLISEAFKDLLGKITRFSVVAEQYEETCKEDRKFELNEIQKESKELHSRLNFLVQKENRILHEIQCDVDQFVSEHIKVINEIQCTEEHSIKFLTENPTMTTLLAILQEQGSKRCLS